MSLENAIVIKNYDSSSYNDVEYFYTDNDWDLVEFNFDFDPIQLQDWYFNLRREYEKSIFAFDTNLDRLNVEKSKEMVQQGYCGVYCGPIDAITLAWPAERYEPLPPPTQCNREVFPEVDPNTFIDDATLLNNYNTGYFNKLVNFMGKDAFRQAIAVYHHPTMKILQHIDSKTVLKLHIPIKTNPTAVFKFGQNGEREYNLKEGKAYLLNTGIWHGTDNPSDTEPRIHLITRVTKEHLLNVLRLTGSVE